MSLSEQLLTLISTREEANDLCKSLLGAPHTLIGSVSLRTPRLDPPELAFDRAVAWLYVQYFEAGHVGIRFLVDQCDTFGIDSGGRARAHLDSAGRLRTYLQHNLNAASEQDARTRGICEDWFAHACGSRVPGDAGHWSECVAALLEDAAALFRAMMQTMRAIEHDEARDMVVGQWRQRISRYHPPPHFDAIVGAASTDMGRDFLDSVRFRQRHYDKWVAALARLEVGYDFEIEARRLVEYALLTDTSAVLPITGSDVIQKLGVEPGPRVGTTLARARVLFENEPCDGPSLLRRLAAEL